VRATARDAGRARLCRHLRTCGCRAASGVSIVVRARLLQMITDKKTYHAGETAKLMIVAGEAWKPRST